MMCHGVGLRHAAIGVFTHTHGPIQTFNDDTGVTRAYLLDNCTQLLQVPQTNVVFHEVHYDANMYHRVRMQSATCTRKILRI